MSITTFADLIAYPNTQKTALVEISVAESINMTWTLHSGNVYKVTIGDESITLPGGEVYNYFEEVSGIKYGATTINTATAAADLAACISTGSSWFHDAATSTLYVNFVGENPNVSTGLLPITSISSISMNNETGIFDTLLYNYIFEKRPVTIRFGGEDLPYSEYAIVFKGIIADIEWTRMGVTLNLQSIQEILSQTTIPAVVFDATYPNIDPAFSGTVIPVAYGDFTTAGTPGRDSVQAIGEDEVTNIGVDTVKMRFVYNPVETLDKVCISYDNQVSWSVAALDAAPLPTAANKYSVYANILADPNLAAAALALENEITANYDPNGTTPSVGTAGTAGASSISLIVSAVAPPATTTPAPTVSPPAAPMAKDVNPTVGNQQVSIQWWASTGATSYNVYYGVTWPVTAANSTKITGITGTSTTITPLTNGTLYYFAVSAVNAGGESALTQITGSGTPTAPPASAPTGVTVTSGNAQVTINWNSVAGAAWYYVYWSTSPGVTTASATGMIYAGTATSLTHSLLPNGTPYYYIVQAANAAGATLSAEVRGIPGAGVTWAPRTSGIANVLYGVAWNGSLFAAVSSEFTNRIRISSDGVNWSAADVVNTNQTNNALYSIAWSSTGGFISVGLNGTYDYSPDGITWFQKASPFGHGYSAAWSGTKWAVVGQTGMIKTSNWMGNVWTNPTTNTAVRDLRAVAWNGAQFVTVGLGGGVAAEIHTSPDGLTWTAQTSGTTNDLLGVACSPATCVAVGSAVSTPFYTILSSPDGITWTPRTSTATNALNAVNWNGTQFLAVGGGGTILTSPDGITWTAQTSGTANALNGITWDGTQYVVVGAAGTILVSNSPFIGGAIQKQLASGGVVTTFAGAAGVANSTDTGTGPATLARFNNATGITTDGTNLYVADTLNHTIRKIVIATGVTTTIAGAAGVVNSTDNATGTLARFNNPFGITTDGTNLYVADTSNATIRQVSLTAPYAVTTIAGLALTTGSTDNATGTLARFNNPFGITTDGTNLYVADTTNSTIRKVSLTAPYAVTTIAGSAGVNGTTDNATGTTARFNNPQGITTDGTNLYVADTTNSTIRQVALTAPYAVTTIAGSGLPTAQGSADGIGAAARFNLPRGITTDGTNLYVVDSNNATIRQIVIASGVVTTIAGTALMPGSADATGAAARFNWPDDITTDGTSLYVADRSNSTIRKIQ